jgi:hypothetical protein
MTIYLRRNKAGIKPRLRKVKRRMKARDRVHGLTFNDTRRIIRLKHRILIVSSLLDDAEIVLAHAEIENLSHLLASYIFEYVDLCYFYPDPAIEKIVSSNL